MLRTSDHVLETTGLTGIHEKLIRETATQFIDIVAFYGLHTYGNGKIRTLSGSQETILQSEADIYGLLSGFQTKNTMYLYIQSNRQRSYNFYGNYSVENGDNAEVDIKFSTNNTTFKETRFNDGWPVYEFQDRQRLAIKLVTDNNSGAGLYVKQGLLNSSVTGHEYYFIRDRNLLQESDSEDPSLQGL